MLVALTRSGCRASVIENQTIELSHAGEHCSKVRQLEQCFLTFEATGDDQQMMVDDVKFIEQGNMRIRDIGDKQIRVIRKERIDRTVLPRAGLARLPAFFLARETRDLPDN